MTHESSWRSRSRLGENRTSSISMSGLGSCSPSMCSTRCASDLRTTTSIFTQQYYSKGSLLEKSPLRPFHQNTFIILSVYSLSLGNYEIVSTWNCRCVPGISGLSWDQVIRISPAVVLTTHNNKCHRGCKEYCSQNSDCNSHHNLHFGRWSQWNHKWWFNPWCLHLHSEITKITDD